MNEVAALQRSDVVQAAWLVASPKLRAAFVSLLLTHISRLQKLWTRLIFPMLWLFCSGLTLFRL